MRSRRLLESYGSRLTPARRPETVLERAGHASAGPNPVVKGHVLPLSPRRPALPLWQEGKGT